ncbi:MAG: phasin family protein [Acetobacteraceae bacterium]
MLGQATRAAEIYRQATQGAGENVQALFASWLSLVRGASELQRAWLEMLGRVTENGARKPQDRLRCKSLEEMAEIQRGLYLSSLNHAMEATSMLLQIAGRVTQDAMRPLKNRARAARV